MMSLRPKAAYTWRPKKFMIQNAYVAKTLRLQFLFGPSWRDFEALGRPSEGPRNLVKKFMLEKFPALSGAPNKHTSEERVSRARLSRPGSAQVPSGVVVSVGGQTPQNLAVPLAEQGVRTARSGGEVSESARRGGPIYRLPRRGGDSNRGVQ